MTRNLEITHLLNSHAYTYDYRSYAYDNLGQLKTALGVEAGSATKCQREQFERIDNEHPQRKGKGKGVLILISRLLALGEQNLVPISPADMFDLATIFHGLQRQLLPALTDELGKLSALGH